MRRQAWALGLIGGRSFHVMVILCMACAAYGYHDAEHQDIARKAIDLYVAWGQLAPDLVVGEEVLARASDTTPDPYTVDAIVEGSTDEDYVGTMPWREHYNCLMYGLRTAPERATHHLNVALSRYAAGDFGQDDQPEEDDEDDRGAYWWLGRVIHLISDMGVPAHVLCDAHGLDDVLHQDWYEVFYAPTDHRDVTDLSFLDSASPTLDTIMSDLIEVSDDFDSVDADGETNAVDRSDGFQDSEGEAMAALCYTGAIKGAAWEIKDWFNRVGPIANLLDIQGDHWYSNLIGTYLRANGKAYGHDYTERKLTGVLFKYKPLLEEWYKIGMGVEIEGTGDIVYGYNWRDSRNQMFLTLGAAAVDQGGCQGRMHTIPIRIDSEPPTIERR